MRRIHTQAGTLEAHNKTEPHRFMTRRNLLTLFVFFFTGLVIYSNSFHNPFVLDDSHIVSNPNMLRWLNFKDRWIFWPTRSLTFFSFAVNYQIGHLNVTGYHVFNLLVHLLATFFVWRFVLLTFKTPAMRSEKITSDAPWVAFFSALVFLTHPLQTEGVTYIFQRAVSMATLFYMAVLTLYIKARLIQFEKKEPGAWAGYYGGALIAASLAMFTKEIAITLPIALLLYEAFFLKPWKWNSLKFILPFAGVALIVPVLMAVSQSIAGFSPGEQALASEQAVGQASAYPYFWTQFKVIVTYLRLLFAPWGQHLDYDFPIAKTFFEPAVLMSFLFLSGILYAAIKIAKKYKLISFSVFFFFAALLPEWILIPASDILFAKDATLKHDVFFEHRCYLPMVGFGIFLACIIHYLFRAKKKTPAAFALPLILIGFYCVSTYHRNTVWADEIRLWSESVRFSPNKATTYLNRGWAYSKTGDAERAIADYDHALRLFPRLAHAYVNRGAIYGDRGDLDRALSDYNQAIEINHDYPAAYTGRGVIYFKKGDLPSAIIAYNTAIAIKPDYAEAYYDRGYAYDVLGDLDRALLEYSKAIELNQDYHEAYNNLGFVYVNKGNIDRALYCFNKALELNPKNASALLNRAAIYFRQRRVADSWKDVRRLEALGLRNQIDPLFLEQLKKVSE